MEVITLQQFTIIISILSGFLILFGLIYKLVSWLSGPSESYQKSLSLDKLYNEAGGNDPLSDALMTTQIDISTAENSCAFLVTYRGVKDRKIECKSGCNKDKNDEKSNFCKQFIYKDSAYSKVDGGDNDTGLLSDDLLDKTYVRRRNASK